MIKSRDREPEQDPQRRPIIGDELRTLPQVLADELEAFGFPPATPQTVEGAHKLIDEKQPDRSALCISGGGIRSASFALGVVQALAKSGLLKRFDYLSTVSGGGYLGSLITSWRHALGGDDRTTLGKVEGALAAGDAPQISHVRRFSNFIAPKLGLTSADSWALVATVLRNLLLNWTVLVAFIAALLMIPWAGPLGVMAVLGDGALAVLLCFAGVCFALGTAYPGFDMPIFANWKWSQKRFLIGWLLPMLLGMLSLATWWAVYTNRHGDAILWMKSTGWGGGLCCVALFVFGSCGIGLLACTAIVAVKSGMRSLSMAGWKELWVAIAVLFCVAIPASLLLWSTAAFIFPKPSRSVAAYVSFGPPLLLCGFFVMNSIYVGIISRINGDDDREWWARAAGWVLLLAGSWTVFNAIVFYAPCALAAVNFGGITDELLAAVGGLGGVAAAFFAASATSGRVASDKKELNISRVLIAVALGFFALLACGVSKIIEKSVFPTHPTPQEIAAKTPAHARRILAKAAAQAADAKASTAPDATKTDAAAVKAPAPESETTRKQSEFLKRFLAKAEFKQFGGLWERPAYWDYARRLKDVLFATVLVALVMGTLVNVNRFSLHATYRNRLVRAFLGASRAGKREPHPFTGFDPADNIEIHEAPRTGLFHVITMAMNLVDTNELAWQERKADSFTASPLHCGNHRIGYRSSKRYGAGLSLGTAMAISGAAANPNQGYHSSPVLALLMTIFNVRLGWWLGNPKCESTWWMDGPKHALVPLLDEALGHTSDQADHVQLSDGGHFDNMGLYEMVLRRCRWIVLIDGEQDLESQFEGLGGAVRKVRIDLGIDIRFEALSRVAKNAKAEERCCAALGTIHYGDGKLGRILYIKPVLRGDESVDVANYAASSPDFPHETTGDQFFSESQFESYRRLGFHEATAVLPPEGQNIETFAALFEAVRIAPLKA